jgi:hypothetical protein
MAQKLVTPLATSLLHFQLNKLFKTWFVFWHYLAWQLFWLLFKKYWAIFSKSSGHPAPGTCCAVKQNSQT